MQLTSRRTQALAASIAALIVAAPIAFRHFDHEVQKTFTKVQTELKSASGSSGGKTAPSPQVTADARRERDDALKPAPKLALGEMPKAEGLGSTTAQPSVAGVQPDSGKGRADAADAEARIAGLDATSRSGSRAASPIMVPQPNLPAEISDSLGKLAATPPAAAPAYLPQPGDKNMRVSEVAKRKLDGFMAAAPGQPVKPDIGWMGRGDDRTPPVVLQEQNRDTFDAREINPVKQVAAEPVSTFSIDVDTASYAFARRALNAGHLPPKDAVRVEEMINYFPYAYPAPDSAEVPFKPTVTVMPSPWNARNQLVHVAIKGYDLKSAERPHANIVLLMDVSGSMGSADRLPLVKNAFRMLVDQLKPDDTVSIVTYASGSGVALEPTKVENKGKIIRAIDELGAGGSTAGAAGIADAYRLAEESFDKTGVNRIILATDGDFNVGITDQNELKSFIERKRQSGIFLSILGVGQGNHNDALMQTLAQNGNGTAAYADTLSEARKVLVEESSSTLFTIAKDVKAQIEWNPARVSEYRLIGYETRALKREDFNNDRVDAGDIGSGHTVTAIYEVTPVGAPAMMDDLRYAKPAADTDKREPAAAASSSSELGFLKLRYKRPNEDTSQLISLPIDAKNANLWNGAIPAEVRFSVAVAAFGQMLKGESYTQGYSYDDVLALASGARGDDPFGYRAEFLNLVRLAKSAQP